MCDNTNGKKIGIMVVIETDYSKSVDEGLPVSLDELRRSPRISRSTDEGLRESLGP